MSLINQMLKDLASRSTRPNPEAIFSGLSATWRHRGGKYTLDKWIFIIIFILTCLLFFVAIPNYLLTGVETNMYSAYLPAAKSDHAPSHMLPPLRPKEVSLTGMTYVTQNGDTNLRFLFDKEALYRLNMPKPNLLQIVLEHTRLLTSFPPVRKDSAIETLEVQSTREGHLAFNLLLKDGVELKQLSEQKIKDLPELQLELVNKNLLNNAIVDDPNKVLLSPNSKAIKVYNSTTHLEDCYRKAQLLSYQGKSEAAITILTQLLLENPEYTPARQTLAALFYMNGDFAKADKILRTGLQQQPFYPPYIQLRAQILMESGKENEALNLLQRVSPPLEQYPDYHALIAALYQRTGKANLAESLYEQLLKVQPRNGIWWMGLGIAREGMDKKPEALDAYAKAQITKHLTPELQSYINSRINSLQ